MVTSLLKSGVKLTLSLFVFASDAAEGSNRPGEGGVPQGGCAHEQLHRGAHPQTARSLSRQRPSVHHPRADGGRRPLVLPEGLTPYSSK